MEEQIGVSTFDILAGSGGVFLILIGIVAIWTRSLTAKDSLARRFVDGFEATLTTVVGGLNQTMKAGLKAARAPDSPGGASLTKEEKDLIKKMAIDELKSYLSLDQLMRIFGYFTGTAKPTPTQVDNFLSASIERKVSELKRADKAAAAADPLKLRAA